MEAGPRQLVTPFSPSLVKHPKTHPVTESRLVGVPNGNIPPPKAVLRFSEGLFVEDGLSLYSKHSLILSGDEEMALVGRLEPGSPQATLIKGLLKNGLW